IVYAQTMATGAHGQASTEKRAAAGPVDRLVEEPAAPRPATPTPHLRQDRIADDLLVAAEVELLHHRGALPERGPAGAQVFGERRAVVRAHVRAVGAGRGGVHVGLGG